MSHATEVKTWEALAPSTTPALLSPGFTPRLNASVRFGQGGDVIEEIDLVWQTAYIDREDGVRLGRLLPHIDGRLTIRDLAARAGISELITTETVQTLYEIGAVSNAGHESIDALSFYRHVSQLGQMAVSTLHDTPLYRALAAGPSRRLLIGYLLEGYHFVDAAASHVAPAIVSATSRRVQMMASEYLAEEYGHGARLQSGLMAAGISAADFARARPLTSMAGIINALRWMARTDPLEYWACLSLSETEGESVAEQARARWAAIAAFNLVPAETLQPYVEHDVLDSDEAHGALCAEPFAEAPPLTAQQQERITAGVLAYARAWLINADEVLEFYGSGDGPLCYIPSASQIGR
jgi:pyrroloquinoline quinone (PQQ) biosynthesis protein C